MSAIPQSIAYKESGIPWVGKIPEHWEIKKVKYLFFISKEENVNENPNVLSLTQRGIIERDISTNQGQLAQSYLGYNIVKVGDIVFNPMDLLSGYVAKSKYNGVISQAYTKIRNKVPLALGFYEKFFQNLYHLKTLWHLGKGVSYDHRWTLGDDVLLNLKIPLPPLEEQKAVADFLDKKTQQIEELITKKQRLITLLEEKKQTLINQCVTQGLDTNAKLKESGIKWLGKIPTHWEVRRLASFGSFLKGGNIAKGDLSDSGVSVILYGDIYTKYEIKTSDLKSKIAEDSKVLTTPIYSGDILFAGSGETKEDIGKNIVYQGSEKAFAGGDIIIFRQDLNDSLFLSYSLNSQYAKMFKALESKGEIIVHIYASNLKNLKIPLPPLEEQKAIAKYLDTQIAKIDLAISKIKSQIHLIKEYKTTLITETVCGRMEIK